MSTATTKDLFDRRIKCSVVSLAYDFASHVGRLDMERYNCCDMGGCLALFRGIDPKVKAIHTYAGGKPDTIYRREGKEWGAYWPSASST
jgi:hypothetical protein